jgi:hypothetical protein
MSRDPNLDSTLLTPRNLRLVDMIRLQLPNGTVIRATNFEYDISSTIVDGSTSETFLSGQGYVTHSAIPLTSQLNANTVNLLFDSTQTDSTAQPIMRTLLNNPIIGGTVHIIKRIISSGSSGTDFIAFKGIMDNLSYKITNTESNLLLFCGGPFSNFDRTAIYGYTNTASQQKTYPNDTGFQYSSKNVRNIKWEE